MYSQCEIEVNVFLRDFVSYLIVSYWLHLKNNKKNKNKLKKDKKIKIISYGSGVSILFFLELVRKIRKISQRSVYKCESRKKKKKIVALY